MNGRHFFQGKSGAPGILHVVWRSLVRRHFVFITVTVDEASIRFLELEASFFTLPPVPPAFRKDLLSPGPAGRPSKQPPSPLGRAAGVIDDPRVTLTCTRSTPLEGHFFGAIVRQVSLFSWHTLFFRLILLF